MTPFIPQYENNVHLMLKSKQLKCVTGFLVLFQVTAEQLQKRRTFL